MIYRQFKIGNRIIDDKSPAYVIAEIGHNHQGDLAKAIELFKAAKNAEVDAVKLQKRDNKFLYTKSFYDKPYDNENSFGRTYGEHREFLEFGKAEYTELAKVAKDLGLDFFATAFDYHSADFLAEFDPPAFKVASADLKSIPLLQYIAKFGKPLIISTGGATLEDIRRAYEAIQSFNVPVSFLQCVATYPTEAEEMNLRTIETLRNEFPDTVIGLSDHYDGIMVAPVGYVLGARIFEKHFTLHHTWKGSDHAMSLEPNGMHKMVRDLQRVRLAIGDGQKTVLPKEAAMLTKQGKSLYAASTLSAGHKITEKDVDLKCPGGGLPPYEISKLIGKTLKVAKQAEDLFALSDVE